MKVNIEALVQAAAEMETLRSRLGELEERLNEIMYRLHQSSTEFETHIQAIRRQREILIRRGEHIGQLAKTLVEIAELYQSCETRLIRAGETSGRLGPVVQSAEARRPRPQADAGTGYVGQRELEETFRQYILPLMDGEG